MRTIRLSDISNTMYTPKVPVLNFSESRTHQQHSHSSAHIGSLRTYMIEKCTTTKYIMNRYLFNYSPKIVRRKREKQLYVTYVTSPPHVVYLRATIVDAINTPTSAPRTPTTMNRVYSSNLAATGEPALAKLMVALRKE